jgi:hypothetical protein
MEGLWKDEGGGRKDEGGRMKDENNLGVGAACASGAHKTVIYHKYLFLNSF